jgi:hypothetical protein
MDPIDKTSPFDRVDCDHVRAGPASPLVQKEPSCELTFVSDTGPADRTLTGGLQEG